MGKAQPSGTCSACFGTVKRRMRDPSVVFWPICCCQGSWSHQLWCRARAQRVCAGFNSWERWGTDLCHLSHTSFCHCSNTNEGALFYFWEGSALLQSWNFPKEWGLMNDFLLGMCPHHFPLGSPTWMVTGGCGCPLAGAGGQSSSGPVPHLHPSALHGQQQESWSIHTKRSLKTNLPFLPSQSLLTPTHRSTEKTDIILNFKNNWGLMEVTTAGYCPSPQEKMPQVFLELRCEVFPVSPQSSGSEDSQ